MTTAIRCWWALAAIGHLAIAGLFFVGFPVERIEPRIIALWLAIAGLYAVRKVIEP